MPEVWCAPGKIHLRRGEETQAYNRMLCILLSKNLEAFAERICCPEAHRNAWRNWILEGAHRTFGSQPIVRAATQSIPRRGLWAYVTYIFGNGPYKTGFCAVAYYFDVERKYTLQVLLFMLYIVEKDMDVKDLLLCEAAKKNGVQV